MDDWVGALERVLEQYILKYKSLELNALGQSLASIAGCLGKFFCIITLHGTKECWESGEAIIALKMQCDLTYQDGYDSDYSDVVVGPFFDAVDG